jgi:uncharacterized protein
VRTIAPFLRLDQDPYVVVSDERLFWIQDANALLYVSPLYIRAETGQLPELKRVIAAYGDRVAMEETFPGALAVLFKDSAPTFQPSEARPSAPSAGPAPGSAREALDRYHQALERLKAGDWGGFGAELEALRHLLEELNR